MTKFFLIITTVLVQISAHAEEIKQADADAIQQAIDNAHTTPKNVKVILDITRGVQKARILVDGVETESHAISGGKNKAHTVEGVRHCAFTTTGTNIKPSHIYRNYFSNEHKVNLAHFVMFDYGRGIGAHRGDVGGRSSGCVRQTSEGAKKVYDTIMANSVVDKGSTKIKSTSVTFDVIDNTPGRYTSECNCLKNFMRDTSSARFQKVCALAAQEPKEDQAKAEVVGSDKPAAKPKPTKPKKPKKSIQQQIKDGDVQGLF